MKKSEKTDREKVLEWLKFIKEFDPLCISEVIENCSKNKEARLYYLNRYKEDCK